MVKPKRYCYACDLKDDANLISEYKAHHKNVWPEIKESIKDAGILDMEIYLSGNRLFMVMEVDDGFDAEESESATMGKPNVGISATYTLG